MAKITKNKTTPANKKTNKNNNNKNKPKMIMNNVLIHKSHNGTSI